MNSIIEELEQILEGERIDKCRPCGRYGFEVTYQNGREGAYYFTAPVFNQKGMVEKRFVKEAKGFSFQGSKGKITILSNGVLLKNNECYVRLRWEKKQNFVLSAAGDCLTSSEMEIKPTLNGVSFTQNYHHKPLYFWFESKPEYVGFARMNSKCFAYMKEKFVPYVTVNSVYAVTGESNELVGADLAMIRDSDTQYRLRMTATAEAATRLNWEVNLYEPKLMQDTTVESRRPDENNAYGNMAFLGHSPDHGVQYLYSRFDFDKIKVDPQKKMERVLLHIPYFGTSVQGVRLAAPFRRFCSFGSTWSNKMPSNDFNAKYEWKNGRLVLDLSEYLLSQNGKWSDNTGIVLCPSKESGVSVLATADNYNTPQMIEIQYKKA